MPHIKAERLVVEFPIYQTTHRSLKQTVMHATTGGRIARDAGNRVVVRAVDVGGGGHGYSCPRGARAATATDPVWLAIQAVCCSGVSITTRPGIRACPIPQISAHWMS